MEFKGTKGEWITGYGNGLTGRTTAPTVYLDGDEEISQLPISKGTHAICWVLKCGEFNEEEEANAKLIAAAPDLLEALQIYLNAGHKEARKEASVIAKKAIEKALK